MTDTLRGNNLLLPSRAANPNMRIKRESSTEKIHSNYGIPFLIALNIQNPNPQKILIQALFFVLDFSCRFESITRFNPLGMSITLHEALVSIYNQLELQR